MARLPLALFITPVLALHACTLRPPPADPTRAPEDDRLLTTSYRHPFPPARLVVHPLTRITQDPDTGERRIEAHFELLDRYGHTVKALGSVSLELRLAQGAAAGAGGGPRQLRLWTHDLSTPDASAQPFDRVTDTYRLTLLELPPQLPDDTDLALAIRFTSNTGVRLSDERRLAQDR